MIKVAINGFGRIGRLVFRLMEESPDYEVVAINDLTDASQLAYLLKYDTNHRSYRTEEISSEDDNLIVGKRSIKIYAEKDPNLLPWKKLGIDVVMECTGHFTDKEKAMAHINAGAKKVIISAPAKGDLKTIVYNVNHSTLTGTEKVISAASCTTNCLAPVLNVLEENFGIENGYMTTIHAYTNDQVILDVTHPKGIKSRRGRAAAANIIPTSTGAASAIGKVIPSLDGKLQGGDFVTISSNRLKDLTNAYSSLSIKIYTIMLWKCWDNKNQCYKETQIPYEALMQETGINDKTVIHSCIWELENKFITVRKEKRREHILDKTGEVRSVIRAYNYYNIIEY